MNRRRGQGLVEFALVMPILLFMIMGIFDFSRLFTTYAVTSNSLRTALRLAEVRGLDPNNPQYANCGAMRGITNNVLFANAPTVTIFYRKAGSPTTTYPCATGVSQYTPLSNIETGDMLNIRLQTTVRFITPFISNLWPSITLDLAGQRTIVRQVQLGSVAGATADSDYDGLNDAWELRYFGNLGQSATDDPDGDGCNNGCEQANGTDPTKADTDGDGIPDGREIDCGLDPLTSGTTDADGDGLTADIECILGLNDHNADFDGDGLSDGYEYNTSHTDPKVADSDGDGLNDGAEVNTYHTNPLAKDSDNDGLWDGAEVNTHHTKPLDFDTDKDGLLDGEEVGYSDGSFPGWGTDPLNWDHDGDGLSDGWELLYPEGVDNDARTLDADDTDPTKRDTDGDGLSDGEERLIYLTNPRLRDTDGDGISDGDEIKGLYFSATCGRILAPTDPLKQDTDGDGIIDPDDCTNALDTDGDGLLDSWEIAHFGSISAHNSTADPDNDGCDNLCEQRYGLDPLHPDTDEDGLKDGDELYVYHTDPLNRDTDGDGLKDGDEIVNRTDPFKPDTDGDGLSDGDELHLYHTNPLAEDSDNDGLSDFQEVNYLTALQPVYYPQNVTRLVSGVSTVVAINISCLLDPVDSDTDNDGIPDGIEILYLHTDPCDEDTDRDGLTDGGEMMNLDTDPAVMDSNDTDPTKWDTDGDGLSDYDEFMVHHTNPRRQDSDNDGLTDFQEVNYLTVLQPVYYPQNATRRVGGVSTVVAINISCPLNPMGDTDSDGAPDGLEVLTMHTDPCDKDTDGDGLNDSSETINGTNALHWDTDGDGWSDYEELTFGSRGYTVTVTRQSGGLTTYTVTNNLDPTKADSDGDGLSDWEETHFAERNYSVTVNGVTTTAVTGNLDPTVYDTDLDGVNDGPEVTKGINPLHWDTDGDAFGDGVDSLYPLNWPVIAVTCQDPTNCTRQEQSNTGTDADRYITFRIAATYVSTNQDVRASYATANTGTGAGHAIGKTGTCALDSGDYLNNSGTAIFNAVGNQNVQVRICRQENDEPDETFNFTIAAAGPNQAVTLVTAPATRTGTITNRNNPTLTVTCPNNPGCTITSSGSNQSMTFRVSAADLDAAPINVVVDMVGVSATRGNCGTAGNDFSRPGTRSGNINNGGYLDFAVAICARGTGDAATETFTFTTTATANDLYLPGNVTATIRNS